MQDIGGKDRMTDLNTLRKFYQQNREYKRYIDACVKTYGRDVEYMLQTRTAEQYYISLIKGGCNHKEEQ